MLREMRARRLELMEKTLEIVEKAGKPVSIYYVAFHLRVAWHVARALLFELVIKGKLKVIDTSKGYLFARGDV